MVRTLPEVVGIRQAAPSAPVPPGNNLHLTLSLPLRNQFALDALLRDLYNPASPKYHHYLSPDEFTERFCPSQKEYDSVVRWAQAKGFTVLETTPNRRLIEASAYVVAINSAFNITMMHYTEPGSGRTFFAPDHEPVIDSPVQLHAIVGLTDAVPKHTHSRKGTGIVNSSGLTEAGRAIAHIAASGPGNTYLPSDMRAAYYGSGPLTGAGQTVGIFSFDGYLASDVALYYSSTGRSYNVPINNVLVAGYNGACTAINGPGPCDDGEQILDIVNVIGMAPGLTQVLFYEGTSATSVLNRMATDNIAKVITSSWGGGDFGSASVPSFQQFQAQGQTYVNATGDSGQFNSQTYAPPSVDPNITQIGGTDLVTNGAGGSWQSETGWSHSGGGFVSGTSIPSYQQLPGVINASNGGSATLRNAPDIAAEADFDNSTVGNGQFQTGFGGTSYAAPRWAGLFALANQQSVANGHGTIGFVNTAIYNLSVGSAYASNFHDITSGSNPATSGGGNGFNAVAGYDLVTGWGSPIGATLINTLSGVSGSSFALSASPSSVSVQQGSSGASTITSSVSGGFNSSVSLSASGLPSGVTATFNPSVISSGAGSSTITFAVSGGATVGSSTVTVTGTGGGLTETALISLTITSGVTPNFTIAAAPASLSLVQGTSGSSTISTTVSGGFNSAISLSASGLPSGASVGFNPASISAPGSGSSTLTITAGASTPGIYSVTVTGSGSGVSHTTTISLTITSSGGTGGTVQEIVDGSFEQATVSGNSAPGWTGTTNISGHNTIIKGGSFPHAGTAYGYLGGSNNEQDSLRQTAITIPGNATAASLTFWVNVVTQETTTTTSFDFLFVEIHNSAGTLLATPLTLSNLFATRDGNTNGSYFQPAAIDLSAYKGQTIQLWYRVTTDGSLPTTFRIDDVSLLATVPAGGGNPPVTALTSPANGATVSGTVTVTATASSSAGIAKIELYIDGILATSVSNTTNLSYSWNTAAVANGSHSLQTKAYDPSNNVGASAVVSVTVSNGVTQQLLGNPGFENGSNAAPWVASPGVISNDPAEPSHSGSWDGWLDGYGTAHTDTLSQTIAIPASIATATLSFWLHIDTSETGSAAFDTLTVQIRNSSGSVLATLATYSNLNAAAGYTQKTFDLSSYKGQTIQVYLVGQEDSSLQTSFIVDDFTLNAK